MQQVSIAQIACFALLSHAWLPVANVNGCLQGPLLLGCLAAHRILLSLGSVTSQHVACLKTWQNVVPSLPAVKSVGCFL